MKSIKEKAKETDRIVERISPNQSIVDMSGRKYFEAGANYVLEEVEKILPKDGKSLNDTGKALLWRIKDTIEQLKGNQ